MNKNNKRPFQQDNNLPQPEVTGEPSSAKTENKSMKVHKDLIGDLQVTKNGLGFVLMPDGSGDVLVRPVDFHTAMNGDTVKVRVTRENPHTQKKEGRIVEVISRRQTEFIGHLELSKNFAFFIPDLKKNAPHFYIPIDKTKGAGQHQRVVARLVRWNPGSRKPEGEIIGILQEENKDDASMKEIMAEAGFPLMYSTEAESEMDYFPTKLPLSEIERRRDLRNILCFTIDPRDSRDFDDALSFRNLGHGLYEVGVHIADVTYYVREGSLLDEESYKRATSVYLPDRVNPMLPERISNELCSLRPDEDKFAFSIIFKLNSEGNVKDYWIGKTVIRSKRRYNYDEVQEILDKKKGDYAKELLNVNAIAQELRHRRFSLGAINFSSEDVRFQLDEQGRPIGIEVSENTESHQLIEEFMLLANRYVAEFVYKTKINSHIIPFPYRIHDQPNEEKLKPFTVFAQKYGYQFDLTNGQTISKSFNEMLEKVKGKPEQHILEQLGIRTMAKAIYATRDIGHYGLGFLHYCHFTSPIRRYPDMMVHRILFSLLEGIPKIDRSLDEKCTHCSEREKAAMECERAGNKYKQVQFLMSHIGETFDGTISGVAAFGFWAETNNEKCEGFVSIASLAEFDDFRHDELNYCLVGQRTKKTFKIGDSVKIKIVAANLEKRQLDYAWINPDMPEVLSSSDKQSVLPVAEKVHQSESPKRRPSRNEGETPNRPNKRRTPEMPILPVTPAASVGQLTTANAQKSEAMSTKSNRNAALKPGAKNSSKLRDAVSQSEKSTEKRVPTRKAEEDTSVNTSRRAKSRRSASEKSAKEQVAVTAVTKSTEKRVPTRKAEEDTSANTSRRAKSRRSASEKSAKEQVAVTAVTKSTEKRVPTRKAEEDTSANTSRRAKSRRSASEKSAKEQVAVTAVTKSTEKRVPTRKAEEDNSVNTSRRAKSRRSASEKLAKEQVAVTAVTKSTEKRVPARKAEDKNIKKASQGTKQLRPSSLSSIKKASGAQQHKTLSNDVSTFKTNSRQHSLKNQASKASRKGAQGKSGKGNVPSTEKRASVAAQLSETSAKKSRIKKSQLKASSVSLSSEKVSLKKVAVSQKGKTETRKGSIAPSRSSSRKLSAQAPVIVAKTSESSKLKKAMKPASPTIKKKAVAASKNADVTKKVTRKTTTAELPVKKSSVVVSKKISRKKGN